METDLLVVHGLFQLTCNEALVCTQKAPCQMRSTIRGFRIKMSCLKMSEASGSRWPVQVCLMHLKVFGKYGQLWPIVGLF